MALGADRARVMTLVLRQGGILVVGGTGLGLLAAVPLVRFVRAMLFEVQPLDPAVFGVVAVQVAAIAMLATFIPARPHPFEREAEGLAERRRSSSRYLGTAIFGSSSSEYSSASQ